jgi:hypothetical protein
VIHVTTAPTERFAIVPLSTPGRTPDDSIVVGPLSEVTEYIGQSIARADAVAELNRARFTADQIAGLQEKTRGVQVSMVTEAIKRLDARMSAHAQRRADAARDRARRDEEEEQKRIELSMSMLPDPDDPGSHGPTGDLHALPAKSEYPDPELAIEDQSEFPDPDPDQPHPPEGTSVPQPTSPGLD